MIRIDGNGSGKRRELGERIETLRADRDAEQIEEFRARHPSDAFRSG